jgi:glyoxylase-like metal-dependent hydrolase (beta-lactamase superfamily II)
MRIASVILALGLAGCSSSSKPAVKAGGWEVLAARYGSSASYGLEHLVRGAAKDAKHPMGWYFWILRQGDTVVLVDAGFNSKKTAARWGVRDHLTAPEVLAGLNIEPDAVDHVIISHAHWDHIAGVRHFDKAKLWIRAEEVAWIERRAAKGKKDAKAHLKMLEAAGKAGRLEHVGGGEVEMLPGIRLMPDGKHTPGAQWVSVKAGGRTVVLASDNAYLYKNLETPVAVGTTVDAAANLAAIKRMIAVAGGVADVVPGHDPKVAERYPQTAPRIHRVAGP